MPKNLAMETSISGKRVCRLMDKMNLFLHYLSAVGYSSLRHLTLQGSEDQCCE